MQKLFLADDSLTIQRVIELTFSGEAVHVVAVADGEQAIARIPIERPDIVLADIGMPKTGGYDVAAFVKGRPDLAHIPVLLLAGAFEPVDQARAEQVRCDGVLIKPFEPRQVIERVRELLDGAHGHPKAPATVAEPVESLTPAAAPAAVANSATELALDDYFESLNHAFANVGRPGAGARAVVVPVPGEPGHDDAFWFEDLPSEPSPPAPRRRGDSLDEYFERLRIAVDHARPVATVQMRHRGADAPLRPSMDTRGGWPHGRGAASPDAAPASVEHVLAVGRNSIVDALEALLAQPESSLTGAQPILPGLADRFPDDMPRGPRELADEVAERVLDRLLPEIASAVRRLAQEEVDRVRRGH